MATSAGAPSSAPLGRCKPEEKLELNKLLVLACWHGEERVVRKLAEKGLLCNEKYEGSDGNKLNGFTPLMLACLRNQKEIFQFLLKHKAVDINCASTLNNRTVLMEAMDRGKDEYVSMLLDQKERLDVNGRDKNKWTSLHFACAKGRTDWALKIVGLSKGQRIDFNATTKEGWTPFMYAVQKGHLELVKEILKKDQRVCLTVNKKRHNAVMIAAQHGRLDCLKEMQSTVPPETLAKAYRQQSKLNWNVLHCVCAGGDLETLKWILEKQREIFTTERMLSSVTEKGYTPLLIACEYKHASIVKLILREEDVNAKQTTKQGLTGLHLAAMHDGEEIAAEMLHYGCDPEAKETVNGNTALHIACEKSCLRVDQLLLKHSSELENIQNKAGQIPSKLRQEVFIPKEIIRRGNEEVYLRALREGRARNMHCNLIVLGEERVGKTSLIKSILGKDFDKYCKPTQGVHFENIGTELTEHTHIKVSQASDDEEQPWTCTSIGDHASDQISHAIAKELRGEDTLAAEATDQDLVEELSLQDSMNRIDQIANAVAARPSLKRSSASSEGTPHTSALRFFPREQLTQDVEVLAWEHLAKVLSSLQGQNRRSRRATTRRTTAVSQSANRQQPRTRVRASPEIITPPTLGGSHESQTRTPVQLVPSQISHHDSRKTVKLLKKSSQSLEPTFHTIDFAGQKHYRPMHHCFITHRALYIVVFKLPVIADCIRQPSENVESDKSPLEEVMYWLNNIYAHASSSIPGENPDPPLIFLVGTHKRPSFAASSNDRLIPEDVSDADLNAVHLHFKELLLLNKGDNRFLESIVFASDSECFFALENSMTPESTGKRKESGIISIQKKLKEKAGSLKFLKMDIPISWNSFEKKLMDMRSARRHIPLSTTRHEVWQWGKDCGMDEEQFDAAMQYFHDIRIIIDQVLIDGQQRGSGKSDDPKGREVVLLNPQWLSDIMSSVVALNIGTPNLDPHKLKLFENKGIVVVSLLKQIWKEHLSHDYTFSLNHPLFTILKHYGLLYPLSEKLYHVLFPSERKSDNPEMMFLFPFKLPNQVKKVPFPTSGTGEFTVDFMSYLPDEVYSHLVIRFLEIFDTQEARKESHIILGNTECKFMYVKMCGFCADWLLKIDRADHNLKVSFKPREAHEFNRPHQDYMYLVAFHEHLLLPVCESSNLGCLRYKCGPNIACTECESQVTLPYIEKMSAEDAVTSDKLTMCCPLCEHGNYDVNQCLGKVHQPVSESSQPNAGSIVMQAHLFNYIKECDVHLHQAPCTTLTSPPEQVAIGTGSKEAISDSPDKCPGAARTGEAEPLAVTTAESELDEDDLLKVVAELNTITKEDDLEELALHLGIRKSAVKKVFERKEVPKHRLNEVVYLWLKQEDIMRHKKGVPPSWTELANALDEVSESLSTRIREKYCHK